MTKIEELNIRYCGDLKEDCPHSSLAAYVVVDEPNRLYHIARSGFSGTPDRYRYMNIKKLPTSVREFLLSGNHSTWSPSVVVATVVPITAEDEAELFKDWRLFKRARESHSADFREDLAQKSNLWKVRHRKTGVSYYVTTLISDAADNYQHIIKRAARSSMSQRLRQLDVRSQNALTAVLRPFVLEDWSLTHIREIPTAGLLATVRRLNNEAMLSNTARLLTS